MVGGLRHGVLSFLHTVVEKSMNFIKLMVKCALINW